LDFGKESALIAGIVSLILAVSVLLKGYNKPVHRAFAELSLTIFIWNIGDFIYQMTGVSLWLRLLFIGVLFIPASAIKFALAYLPEQTLWQKRTLRLAYGGGAVFLATVPTPWFDSPWWNVTVIVFLLPLLAAAAWYLYQYAAQIRSAVVRTRLQFLSIGGIAAGIAGMTDFLPALGIPFPQLGSMAVLIYLYAAATGILRYHLFDVPHMIAKGIFVLLQVFLLGVLLTLLITLFGNRPGAFILSVFFATLLILLLEPLRNRFQREANIWFTKDYKALRKRLRDYSNQIAGITSLNQLERGVAEEIERFPGVKKARLITVLSPSLQKLLEDQAGPLLVREGWTPTEEKMGGAGGYGMLYPIRFHTDLLGAVEIQEKEGHDPYSNRELRALAVLANQVAAAILTLRAQEEIRKKEKLAAVGELAAGLAHEIRNPLANIKGAANYLKGEPTAEESREFLEIIREEVNRLNQVVSEFLDYARPFKKDLARVNMKDFTSRALNNVLANGAHAHVEVALQVPGNIPEVELAPDQIKQVLHNLAMNAVEAMPNGGELTISANAVEDKLIEITVQDTGVGIPSENLSKVFQPFFTTKEQGIGLGLAICYRIVEGHGGAISVESEIGKGSQFRIRLPLQQTGSKE
jgi:signal transduction histidine kinase